MRAFKYSGLALIKFDKWLFDNCRATNSELHAIRGNLNSFPISSTLERKWFQQSRPEFSSYFNVCAHPN